MCVCKTEREYIANLLFLHAESHLILAKSMRWRNNSHIYRCKNNNNNNKNSNSWGLHNVLSVGQRLYFRPLFYSRALKLFLHYVLILRFWITLIIGISGTKGYHFFFQWVRETDILLLHFLPASIAFDHWVGWLGDLLPVPPTSCPSGVSGPLLQVSSFWDHPWSSHQLESAKKALGVPTSS